MQTGRLDQIQTLICPRHLDQATQPHNSGDKRHHPTDENSDDDQKGYDPGLFWARRVDLIHCHLLPGGVRAGPPLLWAARFWLLSLLALGFLSLRPFLCVRLGRRLRLRKATAHTTQHSHEHLIAPRLSTHILARTVFPDQHTSLGSWRMA